MKRVLVLSCTMVTVGLIAVIIYRISTGGSARVSEEDQARAMQMALSYSRVSTQQLGVEEYGRAVREKFGANLDHLTPVQRSKLFAKIEQFYACYSSGEFEKFKRFRLSEPYTVGDDLASAVKKLASQRRMTVTKDEDLLRLAWEHYNGTNRLTKVDLTNATLSVFDRRNFSEVDLYRPTIGNFPEAAVVCWEGAVVYHPTPAELLKRHGVLTFFTLDHFVRCNQMVDGPAMPLRLIGYWDPDREDWMPLALCTLAVVGNYGTIF